MGFIHDKDNTEPPHASVQPGGSDLDQPVTSRINSTATCEGLRLKAGQLVHYTGNESGTLEKFSGQDRPLENKKTIIMCSTVSPRKLMAQQGQLT